MHYGHVDMVAIQNGGNICGNGAGTYHPDVGAGYGYKFFL